MDFLTNISSANMIGAGLGVMLWAYLFFFSVGRAKVAGALAQEPVLWFYGITFKTLRGILAIPFGIVGFFLPIKGSLSTYLSDSVLGWSLGLECAIALCLLAYYFSRIYIGWREAEAAVVLEDEGKGKTILQGLGVFAFAGATVATPWIFDTALGTDPEDLIAATDFGGMCAIAFTVIFFWIVPAMTASDLDLKDIPTTWVYSPGLNLFRWAYLALISVVMFWMPGALPGFDFIFATPMPIAVGIGLPLFGAALFFGGWVHPMRRIYAALEEEDFIAEELQQKARLIGIAALIEYRRKSRMREKTKDKKDSKLCTTCLRPIDDIELYASLKFDACPHCESFIPPLFNIQDFLSYQAEFVVPLIEEDAQDGKKKKGRKPGEDSKRMQELLRSLLAAAMAQRGTDIHMLSEDGKFLVRCRTDGVLFTMMEFDGAMARPMISTLKVMANMDISERRKPQDGSFKTQLLGQDVDLRINTSPVGDGEMAAGRLLYPNKVLGSIENMGMSPRNAGVLKTIILRPAGLILVTGPTGSGKSTTLYNSLDTIATGTKNIITLEDPIEYRIPGVTQMQVDTKKGFTFATGLRSILRQDPDVIMVGEIRDKETAKMAIDSSATGHLVFSTLHATDSVSAAGRLTDLGIESDRLSATLLGIIAQRLIRVNCGKCKAAQPLTREQLHAMGIPGAPDEVMQTMVGSGCPQCRETGFFGREGLYEFFVPNETTRALLARGAPPSTIRKRARADGMRTMLEDGITKVLLGRTTVEEVTRVTN